MDPAFKVHADAIFNSALLYEVSVLRPLVEPLLLQIDRDVPIYTEARRLLAFLQWVRPSSPDLLPDNSILREFVGGSILRHFSMFQSSSRSLRLMLLAVVLNVIMLKTCRCPVGCGVVMVPWSRSPLQHG